MTWFYANEFALVSVTKAKAPDVLSSPYK